MNRSKNLLLILFTTKLLISRMESILQGELNGNKNEGDYTVSNFDNEVQNTEEYEESRRIEPERYNTDSLE